jgi:predicted ATPase
MPVMIGELYDALKEAGASEEKARAAATSVAVYENRFAKLETDLAVLKWIAGTNVVLTLAVLAKLLIPVG